MLPAWGVTASLLISSFSLINVEAVSQAAPAAAGRIAFASNRDGDFDIYVMNADGSGQRALTRNSDEDREPVWSPDAAQLAYVSRPGGIPRIFVIDARTGRTRPLIDGQAASFAPSWSPDGTRIAFVSEQNSQADLYSVRVDGADLRRLTADPTDDWRPLWSPDGQRILFLSARNGANSDGAAELFSMPAAGGAATPVTQGKRGVMFMSWAPDSARLAFHMLGNRRLEVVVVSTDGGGELNLSDLAKASSDVTPVWSPDGRRLAFVSDRDQTGALGVFVMNPDGAAARRLSAPGQVVMGAPAWSPDGRVVYTAFAQSNWELFVVDGSSAPRQLTTGGMNTGAAWAPGRALRQETH